MQIKYVLLAGCLGSVFLLGCSRTESTDATEPNSGTGATGMAPSISPGGLEVTGPKYDAEHPADPAGAPNVALGKPMGNGFRSLTADQAGGMGTGLQGFNDVGAAGTTGAITDTHHPIPGDQSSAGGSSIMSHEEPPTQ